MNFFHLTVTQIKIFTTNTCFFIFVEKCRYGFPRFPTPTTTILDPFPEEEKNSERKKKADFYLDKVKEHLESYRKELRNYFLQKRRGEIEGGDFISNFDDFPTMLRKLNISESDYYDCMRANISMTTIFYRREPNAIEVFVE
jgi:hypothetical protein